jgi:flagellar assembly protein FliH
MSSVIRREDGPTSGRFTFHDLEKQARTLLTAAEQQARRIIGDAEGKAQALAAARQEEGFERGLAEGRRRGQEQIQREAQQAARQAAVEAAQAHVAQLAASLAAGLADFETRKRGLLAAAEAGLLELALAVARRVCKLEVARSAEPARANARALLEMVQHDQDLALHVHPDEHNLLADVAGELLRQAGQLRHVQIIADPAVARGGCVLHTRHGTLNAAIDGQLDRVAEALCGDPQAGQRGPTPATDPAGGPP